MNNLKFAFRQLLKNLGFSAVVVSTLALGIGATIAVFSIVNAVLLKPLPYPESERLVELTDGGGPVAIPNFIDWKERQTVFESMFLYKAVDFNVVADEGAPLRALGVELSAEAFSALRAAPAIGRFYSAEEDKKGGPPVVVLSHAFWRNQFGGDPDIVNQTLSINGADYTILGAARDSFELVDDAALFVPLEPSLSETVRTDRHARASYQAIARLKPGVSFQQAKLEMTGISERLAEQYPDSNKNWPIGMRPLLESKVGGARRALWILFGATALVLLVSCANAASLFMARAIARRKEMAVRSALGADRTRIIRQMLAESLLLASLGAAAGLLLAWGSMRLIVGLAQNNLPRAAEIGLDGSVLMFSIGAALFTGVLFGIAPAWLSSRPNLSLALNETSRGSSSGKAPLLQGLAVGQVLLTFVLLIGAGLLLRSFQRLHQVDAGFEHERVLSFRVDLPPDKYETPNRIDQFAQGMLERLRATPGVQSASLATQIPIDNRDWASPFVVEGRPEPAPSERPGMEINLIGTGYFQTLGIPILKGRTFNENDAREFMPDPETGQPDFMGLKSVIIDEEFARRHFPGEDPIGKRIRLPWGAREQNPILTVAGVAGSVKHEKLREDDEKRLPMAYLPYRERPNRHIAVLLKTTIPPETLASAAREQIAAMDPVLPIYDVRTLSAMRKDNLAPERLNLTLLGVAAAMALALAVVGIYGVVAFSVAQRRREIGVRMALGAKRRQVVALVLGQGMRLVLIGAALGLVGAFGFGRVLSSLLYQVGAADLLTITLATTAMMAAAVLACAIPARRAAGYDPAEALRNQ